MRYNRSAQLAFVRLEWIGAAVWRVPLITGHMLHSAGRQAALLLFPGCQAPGASDAPTLDITTQTSDSIQQFSIAEELFERTRVLDRALLGSGVCL